MSLCVSVAQSITTLGKRDPRGEAWLVIRINSELLR